jgi:hypothetical protein
VAVGRTDRARERLAQLGAEPLRLAGSLKHGWISASPALTRLHANAGRAPPARELQEYGRLVNPTSRSPGTTTKNCAAASAAGSTRAQRSTRCGATCSSPAKAGYAINPHGRHDFTQARTRVLDLRPKTAREVRSHPAEVS